MLGHEKAGIFFCFQNQKNSFTFNQNFKTKNLMATIKKGIVIKKAVVYIFFPVIIALVSLSIFNIYNFNKYASFSNKSTNKNIFNEIVSAIQFQDLALNMVEAEFEPRLQSLSDRWVKEIYPAMPSVDKANLQMLRSYVGMDAKNEDVYFIDTAGTVVNTTFEKDKKINLFSFGEKHKQMIKGLFDGKKYVSERFTIEASTKRLKKYCYQPTPDGKYLIELGIYSKTADETVGFIIKRLDEFTNNGSGIVSVDFFIAADEPYSLNKKAVLDNSHIEYLKKVVASKDRQSINIEVDNKMFNYEYIYIPLQNSVLYKDAVIRIISDRSEDAMIFSYMTYSLVAFGAVLILSVLIFFIQVMRYKDFHY